MHCRYANLVHLKLLELSLPNCGWVLTQACSQYLVRRFPNLEYLELRLSLGSTHDLAALAVLAQHGCLLEVALEAESEPDPGSADQDAELCRLLGQLEHIELGRLRICVASLTEVQQQQLGQMRHIDCLDLELDSPFWQRSYEFPLVSELDVYERKLINQDGD